MKINVHAGHNPDGKKGCGAVGLIKESTQARKVVRDVIKYLRQAGHTVYDCTVNNGKDQADVLNKIIAKCNAHNVDLDVSVHFNCGAKDEKGNGRTTGVEVLVYDVKKEPISVATNVCNEITKLGFRNRGVKANQNLAVLNSTKAYAMLIECCFIDDVDDVEIYNAKTMAQAIVKGILNSYVTYRCTANKSIGHFNNNMVKVGTVKKGFEFVIDKVDFKKGCIVGKRKKTQTWVKLKYTTLQVEK